MPNKAKLIDRLRLLKQSIKNNPSVLSKYDTDRNGKICGEEWERARQETISNLPSQEISELQNQIVKRTGAGWENTLLTGVSIPGRHSGYGPLRVESFWGALAMFCLCHIYFFILFEGFVFISGTPASHKKLMFTWFGILFLVSVSAQIEALIKIETYFSEKPFNTTAFHITSAEDLIKCLLAIVLGLFFLFFCLGYYPFPSKPHEWWHTLLFYMFIWVMSFAAAKNLKGGIRSIQPLGLMNVIPVIMGLTFFTVSTFLGDIFYFAGTFGMGFALIPIRPLLLCNQTRLLSESNKVKD